MEPRGMMGGFYKVTEWIMRISGSNLLWMLCSLPFFFFLVVRMQVLQIPELEGETATLYAMGILAPFTIFPATAALFTVVRKWVMGETDLGIIKLFFRGYKENYKQSMLGGIFYTALIVIMYFAYFFYMNEMQNLQVIGIIMLVLLVLLLLSLFNFFSIMTHLYMSTKEIIKNAVLLSIIKPFRLLSTALCVVFLGLITLRFTWLIMFGFASLSALVAFFNFYNGYAKIQEKAEKMRAAEEEGQEAEEPEDENAEAASEAADEHGEVKELTEGDERKDRN
ncbi:MULTISPECIES: YesL family protein [Paenibacillus]|uniref:DUF624 domain-containing protein n=2 Tax=Paenibacillus TaxID=44249 RepID=A0A920CIZ6_9BACL|nr:MULTISPECIES: DUF624 domain-containing protein [Paenibacillus]GIO37180.1 hypothetical protein J41TS12_20410 [Paenibacillus antibioticophila]GIO41095.1 hypothetical protein J41TS4_08530 [Paenibacillus apis]